MPKQMKPRPPHPRKGPKMASGLNKHKQSSRRPAGSGSKSPRPRKK